MKKPWYFMPFIAVYKIVFFVLLLPFYIVKYTCISLPIIGKFLYKHGIIPLGHFFLFIGNLCKKGFIYLVRGVTWVGQFFYKIFLSFITFSSFLFYKLCKWIVNVIKHFILYTVRGVEVFFYEIVHFLTFLFPAVGRLLVSFFLYFMNGIKVSFYAVYKFFYYFVQGILCIFYILYKILYIFIYYFVKGITCILYIVYRILMRVLHYMGVSILSLFAIITSLGKAIERKIDWMRFIQKRDAEYEKVKKLKAQKERERKQKELLAFSKQKEALEKARKNIEKAEKAKNEPVKEEKPPRSFKEKVRDFFYNVNHFDEYFKNKKIKKATSRPALVIDFAGADAIKSDKKVLYEYVAKTPEGKVVKDYFEAFSKVEVHSFLMSEGYEVYSIKSSPWITFLHGQSSTNKTKIKTKDLIFFITQLSTYVKAGIPLADALKILSRQHKKPAYKKIFSAIVYDLTMGVAFSEALEKQGNAFPKLLINMVKTSEMTGELPEALDDMSAYYTEAEKTRKQMVTALMYPTMVLVFATAVVIFILIWVIPQFVSIYQSMDASKIPAFTLFVLSVSDFLKAYLIWLILGIVVFVVVFVYLYKHIQGFRKRCQWLAMHLPVFGNVIIYNEVTMFTKTFSSLLKHNVFITDSMEILTKVTNNEIYKLLIVDTINNIAHGDKISKAFENHWAFPIPAYEMLVTGEKTGQLPDMMAKVSTYYQEQHAQQVARIKTFVEPVLIIFLTVVVGMIILAIIIPMFGMYDMIE